MYVIVAVVCVCVCVYLRSCVCVRVCRYLRMFLCSSRANHVRLVNENSVVQEKRKTHYLSPTLNVTNSLCSFILFIT